MSFKTILSVTSPDMGNGDLKLAASLCESIHAHLSILVVQVAAPPPIGDFATFSDTWLQERLEDKERLTTRRDEVTALLAAGTVSADIATEYPELAWADEAIGRRARYADLTLIGPEVLGTKTLRAKSIEGALFSSGKPLLLIPSNASATLAPRRILVAWDGSIEASRAVREARGMLVAAADVRLVLVDPHGGDEGNGAEPGADAATYLARHGVSVTVERLPNEGLSVAEVLARRANDFGADMLVMGGYGHSRLRERIFGGVTKSMLDEPPLPIFMAR